MLPILNLSCISIPMYGLCILTGLIAAGFLGVKLTSLKKKNVWDFAVIAAVVSGCGFAGAKILYILIAFPAQEFFQKIFSLLFEGKNQELSGGFVFYGGLIGGFFGYFIGLKITKTKISDFIDVFAVIIPCAHAFGRIGCFCAGCCYGIACDIFCAVEYTNPFSSAPLHTALFPVQLLEAILLFLLCIFLFIYDRKEIQNKERNIITGLLYFLFYSVIRFFLEFLRFDKERGFLSCLSTSQIISILVFTAAAGTLIFLNRKKKAAR